MNYDLHALRAAMAEQMKPLVKTHWREWPGTVAFAQVAMRVLAEAPELPQRESDEAAEMRRLLMRVVRHPENVARHSTQLSADLLAWARKVPR